MHHSFLIAFVGLSACSSAAPDTTVEPPGTPQIQAAAQGPAEEGSPTLWVEPGTVDFTRSASLRDSLASSAHSYFRFINEPFARRVCARFPDADTSMPTVQLHGDAHIEQYVVTSEGRGMSDFDYAAVGPPMIDLARMGVSLQLAARDRSWPDDPQALLDRMLQGYRAGVSSPEEAVRPPAVAVRLAERLTDDRTGFLEVTEALMDEVTGPTDEINKALARYQSLMTKGDDARSEAAMVVKKMGALHIGIGSALSEKYLFQVEGKSSAYGDDQVIEARIFGELDRVPCMRRGDAVTLGSADALRPLSAYQSYQLLALVRGEANTYWFHRWTHNYREVSVEHSAASIEELSELGYDAGLMLGRGHAVPPEGKDTQAHRAAVLEALDGHRSELAAAVAELTAETLAASETFRKRLQEDSTAKAAPAR